MNSEMNSCLMLAVNLETPVSLGCVFDSKDLKDTGIELDSHITLLYAAGKELDKDQLLKETKHLIGERIIEFMDLLKEEHLFKVLDYFTLDSFENDSDYIVLKLKPEKEEIFNDLRVINKGLRIAYDVDSEFKTFSPHITLAELKPGTAKKYLESEKLNLILEESYFDFDDLVLSYGKANEVNDRKQYFLTNFNCVDRYFRIFNLKKELEELYEE